MNNKNKGAFVVLDHVAMDKVSKKVRKAIQAELKQNAEIRRKSYRGLREHYIR